MTTFPGNFLTSELVKSRFEELALYIVESPEHQKHVFVNLLMIIQILIKFYPKASAMEKTGVDDIIKQLKWYFI